MELVKDTPKEVPVEERAKKPAPINYDPNKKYRWQPTDEFVLSGAEFSTVLNATRAILNSPEARIILLAQRANEIAEEALKQAVESGMVKEVDEPKTTK